MKIAYERHPVSAERKAELVKQGFKIVDERFRPASAPAPAPVVEVVAEVAEVAVEDKPKRVSTRKASA